MLAIEVSGLTKRYGDVLAVDAVDLRVAPGEIYAFLGLNGAGKTTTIRALLGMVRPSGGRVSLLGEAVGPGRALLHSPALVVLDEPANGLDPAGVVEIRELLRVLARDHGVTVFLSSHHLAEVDRLATRIGVIHGGRLVEELDAGELDRRRERRLVVDARDRPAARRALAAAGYALQPQGEGEALVLREARAVDAPDEVARTLVAAGAAPTRLAVEQQALEDHFLDLVGSAA
jgi:ABC-2 type transport system ATP-binding protein